jgi:hypothetical protein
VSSKLNLYNSALRLIGDIKLSALTDDVEARYVIDDVFEDACFFCLESGYWNFAMRAVQVEDDPSVVPQFNYQFAFGRPTDWLRTASIFADSYERDTVTDYAYEQGYWYANITPLYIRYVSNDNQYGMDLGKWTMHFQRYVEAHIAAEVCTRLSQSTTIEEALRKKEEFRKRDAQNKNAMENPARFPPLGQWARSRAIGFRSSSLRSTGRGL